MEIDSLGGERLLADVHCFHDSARLKLGQNERSIEVTRPTVSVRLDAANVMRLGRMQRHHEGVEGTLEVRDTTNLLVKQKQ